MAQSIAEALLASGVSGLVAALVLFVFLKPAVKKHIEHSYEKLLEQARTDQVLVSKRYDLASNAMNELALIHVQLLEDLGSLAVVDNEKPLAKILSEVHPIYRARFRISRSQLEPTNDLLSFYSLSFDALLHPDSLKEIFRKCKNLKTTSDYKYAYRSIWLLVIESMYSLLRVSASHRFWNPEQRYAQRARAWAEHERDQIAKHLVARFSGQLEEDGYFSLELEQDGGVNKFWNKMPPNKKL